MKLNEIRNRPGSTHARKRVGRGIGSGTGKTSTKGHKGQKARSGVAVKAFEGGQMPLYRRLPKRGFNNIFRRELVAVNLGRLQRAVDAGRLDAGSVVDADALRRAGVVRGRFDGIKVLAKGVLTAKMTLRVSGASEAAVASVHKAGGTIEVIPAPAVKKG